MSVFYFFDPGEINAANDHFGILEDLLGKHRIKISRISCLNDPFDLQPSFSESTPEDYIKGFREKFKEIDDKLGIICFSKEIYNVLLWSHYAAKHNGFALELELEEKRLARMNYSLIAPEVIHTEDCPRDSYYQIAINSILKTKAIDWAYEKEWRLILNYSRDRKNIQEEKDANGEIARYFPLPEESIKSIFMGLRCTMEQEQLKEKLKEWGLGKTSIYKMEQDRTGYSLVCPEYEKRKVSNN